MISLLRHDKTYICNPRYVASSFAFDGHCFHFVLHTRRHPLCLFFFRCSIPSHHFWPLVSFTVLTSPKKIFNRRYVCTYTYVVHALYFSSACDEYVLRILYVVLLLWEAETSAPLLPTYCVPLVYNSWRASLFTCANHHFCSLSVLFRTAYTVLVVILFAVAALMVTTCTCCVASVDPFCVYCVDFPWDCCEWIWLLWVWNKAGVLLQQGWDQGAHVCGAQEGQCTCCSVV